MMASSTFLKVAVQPYNRFTHQQERLIDYDQPTTRAFINVHHSGHVHSRRFFGEPDFPEG